VIVPALFLLVSLWGAWFTWNIHRPIHRPAPLATISFFAGWITGELPLHHLLWQAVATVAFVAWGALDAWPGQLGLAITLVSWGGLVAGVLGARRAEHAVERALEEGLGRDYRDALAAAGVETERPGLDWRWILFPFRLAWKGVDRVRNVTYATVGTHELKCDVYRRADRPHGCPVLLQVHGGGWVVGSKDEQGRPLMNRLAREGWVCVAINYRLSPRATFPDHLIDVKRALAWIRRSIAEYGGDPRFVVVTGGSAGGHLAALTALTANEPEYQPGFEDADTTVQGCIAFYGVYDFTNRHRQYPNRGLARLLERHVMKEAMASAPGAYDKASPLSRIHPEAPPFFVIHGDRDTLVPVADARHFVTALRETMRAPVLYAEIPGAQHAFEIFPSLRAALVLDGVGRFAAWLRARERGGAATHPSSMATAAS
jgi:acetyl esterase/lipase